MTALAEGKLSSPRVRGPLARAVLCLSLLCSVLLQRPEAALAADWTEREFARFRLLPGVTAVEAARDLLVGLEVELAPGWQFYSENPGDYGVAPRLDWSASRNLAEAEIHWPAPKAYIYGSDPTVSTLGYKDSFLLPLALVAERSGEALDLRLALDYAVCEAFCVVDRVELRLTLPPGRPEATGHDARLRRALGEARAR